jgi:N6-L-threonylcarbamoyladenine synthase
MTAWAGIERLGLNLVYDVTFAARPCWPLDANAEAARHGKA